MSTTQKFRSPVNEDQITDTWSSVFIDECSTVNHSTTFVKQLLAASLSCITYLRSFFAEAAYGDKIVNGLNLKLLLSDCRCIGPNTFVQNTVACFDAIEKQYLKEMKFIVYEHDPDCPLEIYEFKFSYNEGCASMSRLKGHSNQSGGNFSIKSPTMKMLRSIILLIQSSDPLPDTVFFGFKLFYYDDVTPANYEPQGFMPVIHLEPKFPTDPARIKAGNVQTTFHSVQLSVKTVCSRSLVDNVHFPHTRTTLQVSQKDSGSDFIDDEQENPLPPSPEPVLYRSLRASGIKKMVKKQTLSMKVYEKSMPSPVKTAKRRRYRDGTCPPRRLFQHSRQSYDNLSSRDRSTAPLLIKKNTRQSHSCPLFVPESPIRCPCGVSIEDDPMVTCTVCSFRQHAACFKLLEEKDMPLRHVCEICADLTHSCTDYSLTSTDLIQVRETCLFRRLLVHLRNDENYHTPASLAQLLHVTTNVGKRLMVRLQSEGALACNPSNDPRGRLVDQKMLLQYVIPHMFHEDQLPDYQMYTSSLQIIRELVSEEDQKSDVELNAALTDIQDNGDLKCDKQRSVTNRTDLKDPCNNAHQNHTTHCSEQNDLLHDAEIDYPMKLRPRQIYKHCLCQALEIKNNHSKKIYTSSLQITRELVSEEDKKSDVEPTASVTDIQENCDLMYNKLRKVASRTYEEDPHDNARENHTAISMNQNVVPHDAEISHPMTLRSRQNENCDKMCGKLRRVVNRTDDDDAHDDSHENRTATYIKQNDVLCDAEISHPMTLRPRQNNKRLSAQALEIQSIHSKKICTSSLQITRKLENEEGQNTEVMLTATVTDIQENVNLKYYRLRSVTKKRGKEDFHNNALQNHTTHGSKQNDALHCVENNHSVILRQRHDYKHHSGQALEIQNIHGKKEQSDISSMALSTLHLAVNQANTKGCHYALRKSGRRKV